MNDARTTAEILAADPDAIILEPCRPEEGTISLAGIVGCDRLTRHIVDALADGRELPEEFLILDTYADAGDPPSWDRCRKVCDEVRDTANFFGLEIRRTFTMLDRYAAAQ